MPTLTTYAIKHENTIRDLCLGRGRIRFFFRQGGTVFYLVLYGAERCIRVQCSHTRFIDRFMMSEGGDLLSLPFTSKTGQSLSVAQSRQTRFFFFFFTLQASKERTNFGI